MTKSSGRDINRKDAEEMLQTLKAAEKGTIWRRICKVLEPLPNKSLTSIDLFEALLKNFDVLPKDAALHIQSFINDGLLKYDKDTKIITYVGVP